MMTIINKTNQTLGITGLLLSDILGDPISIIVASQNVLHMKCVVRKHEGDKQIGWLIQYNGNQ